MSASSIQQHHHFFAIVPCRLGPQAVSILPPPQLQIFPAPPPPPAAPYLPSDDIPVPPPDLPVASGYLLTVCVSISGTFPATSATVTRRRDPCTARRTKSERLQRDGRATITGPESQQTAAGLPGAVRRSPGRRTLMIWAPRRPESSQQTAAGLPGAVRRSPGRRTLIIWAPRRPELPGYQS